MHRGRGNAMAPLRKPRSLAPTGNWKGGDSATMKVAVAVSYYKFTSKGEVIIEIDVLNLVEKVDGKDRLAEHRKAIGL